MKKLEKVQKSASADSREGKAWEVVFADSLRSRGWLIEERAHIDGYDNEIDILVRNEAGDIQGCVTIAHVKQRNPKEKFYRLLDELSSFKVLQPTIPVLLLYIGDFLATTGWPQVLERAFDGFCHVPSKANKSLFAQLSAGKSLSLASQKSLATEAGKLSDAIKSARADGYFSIEVSRIKTEGAKKNLVDRIKIGTGLTQIRRPLLAGISLPPAVRKALIEKGQMLVDRRVGLENLNTGSLDVQASLRGNSLKLSQANLDFLRNNQELISDYERAIRQKNPIYSMYLDDLHDPSRLRVLTNTFKARYKVTETRELLAACRLGELPLQSRVTNWFMDAALCAAGLSRNGFDKLLQSSVSGFPNARNVTGRYIYGDLPDSSRLPLTSYESGAALLIDQYLADWESEEKLFEALVEDRRYALSVIQRPRPLDALIDRSLLERFPDSAISRSPSLPTVVKTLSESAGEGSSGRLGVVPFERSVEIGSAQVFIRFLSGFDRANINHKLKELCFKSVGVRMARHEDEPLILIAVLDGDWERSDLEHLIHAGYDYVVSVPEFAPTLDLLLTAAGRPG